MPCTPRNNDDVFNFVIDVSKQGKKMAEREALVVCSGRNMGVGISIWDVETGDRIMHIPTCASSPHGLCCLRDQFLVASQVHKHGSVGGGAILTWSFNKPQTPIRSYPIEAIGPLSCTKDGVYLAGGASSGNAYIWEVNNGRLLRTWHAHYKSLKCMVFSIDDSLLISGSDDGIVCIWSMVRLLDMEGIVSSTPLLHYSSEHRSSITGLLTTSGIANSIFLSSSLDATCKMWDLFSGNILQTQEYPSGITAIVLHPAEQYLFAGTVDGRIFVNMLDNGLMEDPFVVVEDHQAVLKGHNGLITALAFCNLGLISASEDCTVCLWDTIDWVILRRFDHCKGPATNLAVIPRRALISSSNHPRVSNQFHFPVLEKCTNPASSSNGMVTLFPSYSANKDDHTSPATSSLGQQIFEMEHEQTPEAIQMKVETSIDSQIWATTMTRHVMDLNKYLQSHLLDLMQMRLFWGPEDTSPTIKKSKKFKIESSPQDGEKPSESRC